MLQNFYYIFGITTTCFFWVSAIVVGIVKYRKIAKRKKEQEQLDEELSRESEDDSKWEYRYFDVDFDNTTNMSSEINEKCSNGSELVQIVQTNKGFKGIFRILIKMEK